MNKVTNENLAPDYCIITMAGIGSRFKKAGFITPKYEIMAGKRTLFELSLMSLQKYFKSSFFIFISLKDNQSEPFIRDKCIELGITNFSVLELPHVTKGQAQTVLAALPLISLKDSILVFNIDTYIDNDEIANKLNLSSDGDIPCFNSDGEHWSFVKKNGDGQVILVTEKKRISNNCSVGAYYFREFKLFVEAYLELYMGASLQSEAKEFYIAPLYNNLIRKNYKITMSLLDRNSVHVLGTPEELSEYLSKETKI